MASEFKRRIFHGVLQNTAFGLLVGVIIASVAALIANSSIAQEGKQLYTFLISALVTLISATFAIAGVMANIENQNRIAGEQRKKKLKSAEAVLPMSLSALIEVCDYGMLYSKDFDQFEIEWSKGLVKDNPDAHLELQLGTIEVFREVIEFSEDLEMSTRLADILKRHQVYRSRWRGHFTKLGARVINKDQSIKNGLVDWALLKALVASVFAYSRGMNDTVETIDIKNIYNGLHTNELVDLVHEDYETEVKNRFEGYQKGLI